MTTSIGISPEHGKALEDFYNLGDKEIEFEIRFGSFSFEDGFIPGMTIDVFDRLNNALHAYTQPVTVISLDSVYEQQRGIKMRKTETLDENEHVTKTEWMIKTPISKFDVSSYSLRFSFAREEAMPAQITSGMPTFMRKKRRSSYTIGSFRYDLTKSIEGITSRDVSNAGKLPIDYTYELEIEYIGSTRSGGSSSDDHRASYLLFYDELIESISRAVRIIQESYFIITDEEGAFVKSEYALLLGKREFHKIIGNQPLTFQARHLDIVSTGYSVTDKTDGDRAQMVILDSGKVYFIKSSGAVMGTGLFNPTNPKTILDGEYLIHSKALAFASPNMFLVFDILLHGNTSFINNQTFLLPQRRNAIAKIVSEFKHLDVSRPDARTDVILKNFLMAQQTSIYQDANTILSFFDTPARPYNIDGLIFTPVNVPYTLPTLEPAQPHHITYKWKPSEESTIDFYGVKVGKAKRNPDFDVWHLWVRVRSALPFQMPDQTLFPLEYTPVSNKLEIDTQMYGLFQPEDKPNAFETYVYNKPSRFYSNTIIEFRFDTRNKYFVPTRTRWDKMYGRKGANFIVSAMDVWETIVRPVTREMITAGPTPTPTPTPPVVPLEPRDEIRQAQLPISARADSLVYNMRIFHNEIKQKQVSSYIKKIQDSKTVLRGKPFRILDLASGKGGDLQKYPLNSYVVGFDINNVSVEEAKRRASSLQAKKKITGEFHYFRADVSKINVYDFISAQTPLDITSFNLVNCQFALHFFLKTEETLRTFFTNVSENLLKGGYFIGTAFNGRNVYNLLKNTQKYVGANNTFTIEKKYSDPATPTATFDDLNMYGQEIQVYLGGDTVMSIPTTEYLVNFEKLSEYAKEFQLEMVPGSVVNFDRLYTPNLQTRIKMSRGEKEYSFLNATFAFVKVGPSRAEEVVISSSVPLVPSSLPEAPPTPTPTPTPTPLADDDDIVEPATTPVESGLVQTEFDRMMQYKPCGSSNPRLTRGELVKMASFVGIKGISKKNMTELCSEIVSARRNN
jgi:hypothetical protein